MPRQMPSTGVPSPTRASISRSKPSSRTRAIAFGKAPTPGRTRPSAPAAASASAVRTTSAPTCSKAFSTERRLPIP